MSAAVQRAPTTTSSSSSRRDGESAEARARRRREKSRKVYEHRARILRKQRQEKAREELTRLHKHKDFIAPLEFDNTLPAVPVESKLMAYPFDDDFTIAYDAVCGVSSEPTSLYRLHAPLDLDMRINLISPAVYRSFAPDERPPMHPTDEHICSEEFARPASRGKEAAVKQNFTWLNRSALMHLDLTDSVYKHADPRAVAREAIEAKRKELEAYFAGPRKARIEAGFAAVSGEAPLVHPTNKTLKPRRVWDVLPDEERWGVPMVQVSFDGDPYDVDVATATADGAAATLKRARLEHAVLRTSSDRRVNVAEGTSVVHYLLPAVSSVDELTRWDADAAPEEDDEARTLHMQAVRDYHMAVEKTSDRTKADETFALIWDDNAAVIRLIPIRARANLTALQLRAGEQGAPVGAALLHRPTTADEDDITAIARAELEEADPAATRAAIAARRHRRAEEAAAARSAVADGVAAGAAADSMDGAAAGVSAGTKRTRDGVPTGFTQSQIEDDFAVEE